MARLKVAFVRDVIELWDNGDGISFSRMVELLNEEAQRKEIGVVVMPDAHIVDFQDTIVKLKNAVIERGLNIVHVDDLHKLKQVNVGTDVIPPFNHAIDIEPEMVYKDKIKTETKNYISGKKLPNKKRKK